MFPLKKRILIRDCGEHLKVGLGCGADYEADKSILYAPFDGNVSVFNGPQGGNWLRILHLNGESIEFAHLDYYLVKTGYIKEGTEIAITGNTGKITTGPHLHIQVFDKNGVRVDPEKYFMDKTPMAIQVAFIGGYLPQGEEFILGVAKYTFDKITLLKNDILTPINSVVGMLTQAQAEKIIDDLNPKEKFVFLYYPANQTSSYAATSYYPKRNLCYSTIPTPTTKEVLIHEFLHQIRKYINANHLGFVEDVEYYPPNWRFQEQFDILLPYWEKIFNTMDRLVRAKKDVFRLHDGAKDLFLNKESFEALNGRWDKIEDITQVELDAIPDGFVLIAVKSE